MFIFVERKTLPARQQKADNLFLRIISAQMRPAQARREANNRRTKPPQEKAKITANDKYKKLKDKIKR